MFDVATQRVVLAPAGDRGVRSVVDSTAMHDGRCAASCFGPVAKLSPNCPYESDERGAYGGEERKGAESRFENRRRDPIDEHRSHYDARREADYRSEQEVAPADVRRPGNDIDDGKGPDRHDAREDDRKKATLAEASRQVVQSSSGKPANGVSAQMTADCERHRTAHRGADHRVGDARHGAEHDGGYAHEHHDPEEDEPTRHEREDGEQRRQRNLRQRPAY